MQARVSRAIIITKVAYEQIEGLYPLLYQQVFKKTDPTHVPGFVYVGQDSDTAAYVGFISAYQSNLNTVFFQYGGFLPEYQGRFNVLAFMNQAIRLIHEEFQLILTLIENTNIRALKIHLACGFKIIGIRQATDKTLLVELLKEK